jgi:aryl-alcohol dehydrogenase-like predicted oxidoreductase
MQYTKLGNTGLVVSKLCFGAMTFGSGSGAMTSIYKVDQEQAKKMVDRALEAGINFFDTADGYADGQSEVILGWALNSHRKDAIVATKVGFRTGQSMMQSGLSKRHIIASCEASLKRLGTDYIDLYQVHRFDPHTPLEETLEALDFLVRSGMVRYVGFSNWAAWRASKAVTMQRERRLAAFSSAQMYYSLIGRDLEHEVAPMLESEGLGLMVWSPLAGGFLSGKYTPETLQDQQNRLSGFDFIPFDKERGFALLETLREIALTRQVSVAQVSLAWLLHQKAVSSVIIGASKMTQLEDNLGAVDVSLSANELERIDALTKPEALYPQWFAERTADAMLETALNQFVGRVVD